MIYLGSDHAGFELKGKIRLFLEKAGYALEDMGPHAYEPEDDYPDFALPVCRKVIETSGKGILICGTGQGMDRVANKVPGIYAAPCWNEATVLCAREHGDANVLTLGSRVTTAEEAEKIVRLWLETPFSGTDRHVRRNNKIREIEKEFLKA